MMCRSVCTVTDLLKPAAAQAERQAACSTLGTSGRSSSRPGNNHRFGRVSRQYVAHNTQELRREHDVTVLAALALLDPDYHPLAIDVGNLQEDHFRYTQSGGI